MDIVKHVRCEQLAEQLRAKGRQRHLRRVCCLSGNEVQRLHLDYGRGQQDKPEVEVCCMCGQHHDRHVQVRRADR